MTDTIRIPVGPSGKRVAWALIDLDAYERAIEHSWYLNPRGYVFSPKAIDGKSVFLHGFILGRLDEGDRLHIDHWNRDKLDNRKANLRVVTVAENSDNSERGDLWTARREQARSLRLAGKSLTEIGQELAMAPNTVARCCANVPGPPHHPNTIWTRESVIAAFRAFYARERRVPSQKDLNGANGMPWFTAIYRAGFKGIVEARAAAGLDAVDLRRRVAA